MKKFLALLLALCMVFALAACGQAAAPAPAAAPAAEEAAPAAEEAAPAAEETAAPKVAVFWYVFSDAYLSTVNLQGSGFWRRFLRWRTALSACSA